MPLYPYRCTACGHEFEKVQKFNTAPETVCPECGGKLERLLTAPGLSFKGAGWYINDYAPKAASGGAAKPAADSGGDKAASPAAASSAPTAAPSAVPSSASSSGSGSSAGKE